MSRRSNFARWWSGYVRGRDQARLARYQAASGPRLRLASRIALWLHVGMLLLVASAFVSVAMAQPIPRDAQRYQLTLKRELQLAWGLQAPMATFAAQVHQESRWRLDARSPVGAVGLAQFMPATANWIGGLDAGLSTRDPTNPTWSLRALVTYDKWLSDRIKADNDCERMAFILSAYNGGLGWVYRDQATASGKGLDKRFWFDSVELVNAGRTAAAWQENRSYPKLILLTYTPRYTAAGWGLGVCP